MTLTSHQQSSCSMSSSARQCTRLRTIPKTLSNPVLGKASSRLRKQLRPFVAEQLPAKKECATRYLVVSSSGYSNSSTDARIKVIGVGGGGGNALNRMVETGLQVFSATNCPCRQRIAAAVVAVFLQLCGLCRDGRHYHFLAV
eukprot:GHRR01028729.1.p1 GENE.GHRR01028729.1~~GHRR01028729.1.p1  ORF type:complete len:143 (-),score=29.35 GHRR01028729.1:253-681(-)